MKKMYTVSPWQPRILIREVITEERGHVRVLEVELGEVKNVRAAALWAGRRLLRELREEELRQKQINTGTWRGWCKQNVKVTILGNGARLIKFDNGELMSLPAFRPAVCFVTELGDEVHPQELIEALRKAVPRYPRSWPNRPRPGASRYRGHYVGFRCPHTFAEHRATGGVRADARHLRRYGDALVVDVDDYDGAETRDEGLDIWSPLVRVRARRGSHLLVDAWDDVRRSDMGNRSWKLHRRHQWRAR